MPVGVTFEVAGEPYPVDDATCRWLAEELRRLDLDDGELPGNAIDAAVQIERALEPDEAEPVRLSEREAVQAERTLDVGLIGSDDEQAIRLLRALQRAISAGGFD